MMIPKIFKEPILEKFDENNALRILKALEEFGELETFEKFENDKILEIFGELETLETLEELEILEVIEEFK